MMRNVTVTQPNKKLEERAIKIYRKKKLEGKHTLASISNMWRLSIEQVRQDCIRGERLINEHLAGLHLNKECFCHLYLDYQKKEVTKVKEVNKIG